MSVNKSNSTPFHADLEDSFSSKFKFRHFKLKWTIEDFELVCTTMKTLESPRFPSSETEKLKWYLELKPTPLNENNEEDFEFFLKNSENSENVLLVNLGLLFCSKQICSFGDSVNKHKPLIDYWGVKGKELYRRLFNKDKALQKELTVICELSLFDSGVHMIEKPLAVSPNSDGLSKHMDNLLENQVFKDVKFTVLNEEFNAHKAILANRSPVFSAMFKNKMSEQLTSTVKIEDIKPSNFQLMLRFIYTDEVENLEESAVELFYAAEKYQLEKLKKMCLNSLYNNLTAKNVVKILELSDTFSIDNLKDKAQEYLILHLEEVKESKEYLELSESRPHLLEEILKQKKKIDFENVALVESSEKMIIEFLPW